MTPTSAAALPPRQPARAVTPPWRARALAAVGLLAALAACRPAAAAPAPAQELASAARPTASQAAADTPPAAATATATPLPSPTPVPETVLLFTGDINPARCVYAATKAANDMARPYRALGEVLRSPDLTIGSLDASLSDYNPPSPCAGFHSNLLAPAETIEGLRWAGFDLLAAATNHIKDCGLVRGCRDQSLLDTRANLLAAGIQPVGIGQNLAEAAAPVIITVHGVRFAFLAFTAINGEVWAGPSTPGAAPFLKDVYVDAVRRARGQADVVIAMPHWGREYTDQLTWEQALGARALVDAGADLVVGNNPHRVQGVERFPNGAVAAYALGNFVFDQEWSDGTIFTLQGLLLRARFRGPALLGVELVPVHIYDNFQPRLAAPDEAAQILKAVDDSLRTSPAARP